MTFKETKEQEQTWAAAKDSDKEVARRIKEITAKERKASMEIILGFANELVSENSLHKHVRRDLQDAVRSENKRHKAATDDLHQKISIARRKERKALAFIRDGDKQLQELKRKSKELWDTVRVLNENNQHQNKISRVQMEGNFKA
jgi:hypothetical protein